jgi:hypothetical protein
LIFYFNHEAHSFAACKGIGSHLAEIGAIKVCWQTVAVGAGFEMRNALRLTPPLPAV